MKPCIIAICGAYRSGSTWQFNAVRCLLEELGHTVKAGGWRGALRDSGIPRADYVIVKEHMYLQDLAHKADMVFTSSRDWPDVLESWRRFKGKPATDAQLEAWQLWLQNWKSHPRHAYHTDYADLIASEWAEFYRIAQRLNDIIHITWQDAVRAWVAMPKPPITEGYDPTSMYFSNHITA